MDSLSFLGAAALKQISEAFGELRHFYSAFDTLVEARQLVGTIVAVIDQCRVSRECCSHFDEMEETVWALAEKTT